MTKATTKTTKTTNTEAVGPRRRRSKRVETPAAPPLSQTDLERATPSPSPATDAPVEVAAAGLPRGKLGMLVGLLRRPEGARIDELMTATGWQAHSVRGAIAGAVKRKLKLTVNSRPSEGGRVYRIETGDSAR